MHRSGRALLAHSCTTASRRPPCRRRKAGARSAYLEALESRVLLSVSIGPTGRTATYTDVDGDLVTVAVSKGTLLAGDFTLAPAGVGEQLQKLYLSGGAFAGLSGVDLTITAATTGTGDGLVNVGYIQAITFGWGNVTIEGDLGRIDMGGWGVPAVQRLDVQSMGRFGLTTQGGTGDLVSKFHGSIGELKVAGDVQDACLRVKSDDDLISANIGRITIGGSLIGGTGDDSGHISCTGNIGTIRIDGSIVGGPGTDSGKIDSGTSGHMGSITVGGNVSGGNGYHSGTIFAASMGVCTLGGSLIGGEGNTSGRVYAGGTIGTVTIAQAIVGGGGAGSGGIEANNGDLKSLTVGGSVVGGAGAYSADLFAANNFGSVRIGGDLRGSNGSRSGDICVGTGSLGRLTIGGSLIGGTGDFSGRVRAGTHIGAVAIAADVRGGEGVGAALIDAGNGHLTMLTVGGSVLGGAGAYSAEIYAQTGAGTIRIGGDMIGGSATRSGDISVRTGSLGRLSIGGSLVGGTGEFSARVYVDADVGTIDIAGGLEGSDGYESAMVQVPNGNIGKVAIGGSILGGSGEASAYVNAGKTLGRLTVEGSVVGGAGLNSAKVGAQTIGTVTIQGSLVGGGGNTSGFIDANERMDAVVIGENLLGGGGVHSGNVNTSGTIGALTVGGSINGGTGEGSGGVGFATLGSLKLGGSLRGGAGDDSGEIRGNTVASIAIAGDLIGGDCTPDSPASAHSGRGGGTGTNSYFASGNILVTRRIDRLFIGGSVISGAITHPTAIVTTGSIQVTGSLGALTVKGSLIGNTNATANSPVCISVAGAILGGDTNIDHGTHVAVGSISVGGRVERAIIRAGYSGQYDVDLFANRMGTLTVTGDWIASSLAVGVRNAASNDTSFGDANDTPVIVLATDTAASLSSIQAITIGGQVVGTAGTVNAADHFGFVAQRIGRFRLGGVLLPLNPLPGTDNLELGETGDVCIHEV